MSTFLSELLLSVADRGHMLLGWSDSDPKPTAEGLIELCEDLIHRTGEATSLAVAAEVLERLSRLDDSSHRSFLVALANLFGVDEDRFDAALAIWCADRSGENAASLHFASEPRRHELFRRLNRVPGGTAALVEMRSRILAGIGDSPELRTVDRDLHHLLSSWFNRGFLVLRRIDWSTPAAVLERVIRHEAVHQIRDWDDLRRRIEPPDRRCYAFFHPVLPDDPLIFIEVALTKGTPGSIDSILSAQGAPHDVGQADTAVFYSISNCQMGLSGVSFGSFLIKQVIDELAREVPGLSRYVTLSPVPAFTEWVRRLCRDNPASLLTPGDCAMVKHLADRGWRSEGDADNRLKGLLMPLAAYYLLRVKNPQGRPIDPVARFHLGNGASLQRINWHADDSDRGCMQSAGLMVNYRYEPRSLEKHHEAFVDHGEIAYSRSVSKLLRRVPTFGPA